jgi:hypothetical protein
MLRKKEQRENDEIKDGIKDEMKQMCLLLVTGFPYTNLREGFFCLLKRVFWLAWGQLYQ